MYTYELMILNRALEFECLVLYCVLSQNSVCHRRVDLALGGSTGNRSTLHLRRNFMLRDQ
jgi:hypothetical protein